MSDLRVVFLGTPEAAVPSLRTLAAAGTPPVLVITQPERPRGRGMASGPSPVAAAAEVLGIPVLALEDVNAAPSVAALHARRPDLFAVVAFGQILGQEVRGLPRLGSLNLHFSVLPRWRGAAPVQRALEAGDATTGVSVQRIVRALDAGPVIARREVAVEPGERAGELEARLADLGAALLADVVCHCAETGELITGRKQDPAAVTRARKVTRQEGRADFALSPEAFCARARAFHPWPLVTATLYREGEEPVGISFHRVEPAASGGVEAKPGSVLEAGKAGIAIACGGGSVLLRELQRPGGRALDAAAFLNGLPLRPGDRFR